MVPGMDGISLESGVDEKGTPISITEAADRLGISEDGVRKRIKKGQLRGIKSGKSWQVFLEPLESIQNGSGTSGTSLSPSRNRQSDTDLLIQELRSEVEFLRSQLQEQLAAKDRQIAEKDQQLECLLTDIEGWREQVRYKELQLAQAQERVIELPFPEEHQPTEQEAELSRPDTVQAPASGNALQRFWRWFVGG
jgi:excisionase family DNA binding protein